MSFKSYKSQLDYIRITWKISQNENNVGFIPNYWLLLPQLFIYGQNNIS